MIKEQLKAKLKQDEHVNELLAQELMLMRDRFELDHLDRQARREEDRRDREERREQDRKILNSLLLILINSI